jgi:hypothetical protein
MAKSKAAVAPMTAPVASSVRYEEPAASDSTTLTTGLAAVLALLTWGIACFLFASVYGLI